MQTLDQISPGHFQLSLGSSATGDLPGGAYLVFSNGGNDIGPFTASLQVGPNLTWSNKDTVRFVDRSEPLAIDWLGGPSAGYVVFGGAGNSSDGVQVAFTCVEDVRNQTLTVPDFILGTPPHTSNGLLFLSNHPLQNPFTAPGIDAGYFADVSSDSKAIAIL